MSLTETERLIENYINVTKGNFIKVGKLLKKILTEQAYKELNFNSFEDYADSNRFKERFNMGSRHAFNLIKVYDTFGSFQLQRLQSVPIKKLIQIAYVQERAERENLLEQAPDLTYSDLTAEVKKTKISPEKSPLIDTPDEVYYKLLRESDMFAVQIRAHINQIKELSDKYTVWKAKASKEVRLKDNQLTLNGMWRGLKEGVDCI